MFCESSVKCLQNLVKIFVGTRLSASALGRCRIHNGRAQARPYEITWKDQEPLCVHPCRESTALLSCFWWKYLFQRCLVSLRFLLVGISPYLKRRKACIWPGNYTSFFSARFAWYVMGSRCPQKTGRRGKRASY